MFIYTKYLLIILLIFLMVPTVDAQNVLVSENKKIWTKKVDTRIENVGDDGFFNVCLDWKNSYKVSPVFEKYDFDNNLKYGYTNRVEGSDEFIKLISFSGNNYALFYRKSKNLERSHYLQELKSNSGMLSSKKVNGKIFTVKKHSRALDYNCNALVSGNGEWLCLIGAKETYPGSFYFKDPPDDKIYGFNDFNIRVFNPELEKAEEYDLKLDFPDGQGACVYWNIDDNGKVQLLYKVIDSDWRKKEKKGIPFSKFYFISDLLEYNTSGNVMKIEIADYNVESMSVSLGTTGYVVYGIVKSHSGNYVGTFIGKIDSTNGKFSIEAFNKFSSENLELLKSSEHKKKSNLVGNNYLSRKYFLNSNGSKFLVFQDYEERVVTSGMPGSGYSYSALNNGNYLVVQLNENNKLIKLNCIKNGYETPDYALKNFESVGHVGDRLYLFTDGQLLDRKLVEIVSIDPLGNASIVDIESDKPYVEKDFNYTKFGKLFFRISNDDFGQIVTIGE